MATYLLAMTLVCLAVVLRWNGLSWSKVLLHMSALVAGSGIITLLVIGVLVGLT